MRILYLCIKCLLISFLFILQGITVYSIELDDENVYCRLFQNEFLDLSNIYKNESLPGFEVFQWTKENATEYPFYAYTILVDCLNLIFSINTKNLVNSIGDKIVAENLINEMQNNLSDATKEFNDVKPNTLACIEWLALAEQYIRNADASLMESTEKYNEKAYSDAITTLINTNSYICNIKNFLAMAKYRNNWSFNNILDFKKGAKETAEKWIGYAESAINHVGSFREKESVIFCDNLLNQSKEYFADSFYYFAIMKAAESKASADFILNYKTSPSHSDNVNTSTIYVEYANIAMMQIYEDLAIDAPLAEQNIEFAKLHLEDLKAEDEVATIISSILIREALTAKEQAIASLDLKNRVLMQSSVVDNPVNELKESDQDTYYVGIVAILTLLAFFVVTLVILRFKMK